MTNRTPTVKSRPEKNPFKVGDRVRVVQYVGEDGTVSDPPSDNVTVGQEGVVTKVWGGSNNLLDVEGVASGYHHYWFVEAGDPESDPEPVERPLVDFSGKSRATAREYATIANSRVLSPDSQAILKQAARGGKVDAYRLNAAVVDAMRSTATRCGQSMARRGLATKVAYLGHIVQAVLENHADQLPAYAEGDRSRAVEDAKAALREAAEEVRASTEAYDRLKSSANEEIDRLKSNFTEEVADLTADLSIVRGDNEKLSDQNAGLRQALKYAANLLREAGVEGGDQRLQGFVDAVLEANQQA